MGACQCQKKKRTRQTVDFRTDKPIQVNNIQTNKQIFMPKLSKLYNILRKTNNVQIINSSNTSPLFKNETNPKLNQMSKNNLKTMYNFKNVVIIGEMQPHLKYLNEVNPKQIYAINQKKAEQFLKQFPIFRWKHQNRIETQQQMKQLTKNTPLLIFFKPDLQKTSSIPIEKIFLHNIQFKNEKIYQELNINRTITISQSIASPQKKQAYVDQLKKSQGSILILHNKNTNQEQLAQLFASFMAKTYKIQEDSALQYINEILGKQLVSTTKNFNNVLTNSTNKIDIKEQTNALASIFKKIEQQSGSKKKTQQVYNVCLQTLSNICSNPENQNYRQIKKSNNRMKSIVKYKNSIQLLEELGWKQKGEYWTNSVDVKYLKVLRIDLEVAYSRFLNIDQK